MTPATRLLALALTLAPMAATARPLSPPQPHPAAKARQAAMDGFIARMSRLDALMGTRAPSRTRSASAER